MKNNVKYLKSYNKNPQKINFINNKVIKKKYIEKLYIYDIIKERLYNKCWGNQIRACKKRKEKF